MMEKVPTVVEKTQHYPPHLKKVLKTYQKSAIKSLQGPSTVLSNAAATEVDRERELNGVFKKEPESSPELPLETPPPSQPPSASVPQVPILSTADQSAELSETLIEGQRISCFIIGGEKRICFVQLLSTVLRNVQAYMINNVVSELFINFSSCNSEQLSALKAKGLLPAETPSCGLVTKPDAERLCSVLLHEGGASPDGIDKHSEYSSFIVYHECFSGAKGVLYYEFYNKENWCVQCVVCRRLFTPQMFVCHSCYMDKKRNSVHTLIETNICHWGFDSTNWPRYIHVLEEQPAYKKYTQILQTFKENHRRSELIPLKRKQILSAEPNDVDKVKTEESAITGAGLAVTTTATVTTTTTITTPKVERADDEDEDDERWYLKKKAKVTVSASVEDGPPLVSCSGVPAYYNFHSYYSNLCESWVRNAAVAAGYHNHHHHPATSWPNYPPIPFTKDSKSYYFTDSVPFLAQDPPVLLHPERVVPLSQSEQFERSYQPNVSLVPPTKTSDGITYSKLKRGVIRVRNETSSPHSPSESGESSSTSPYLCKDSRLTEKMEVKIQPVSPSDSPLPLSRSPHTPAPTEPLQDNGVNSFVEHIAAVLDALGDAEDAVRQRVVQVVERMTLKIKHSDLERQKYREEMAQLRVRMSQLEDVNMSLFCENTQLRQQLEQNEENHVPVRSPSPSPSAIVAGNSAVTTSYLYSNRNTPGISSKQPICSPVSVITSPPPSLSVIRSESAA